MHHLKELIIELTDQCPHKCRHCSSCSSPKCANHLSKEVVGKILNEAELILAEKVCFGGGEPTISPIFGWTLSKVRDAGMESEVFSCGVNYDDHKKLIPFSKKVLNDLASCSKNNTVVFSIHGHQSEQHDYITRVPGSFEMMKRSISKCLDRGINCVANMVPTKLNRKNLREIVDLVDNLGMPKLSLLRFVPQGRGEVNRKELELTSMEEDKFVADLLHIRDNTNVELRTGSPFNGIVPDSFVPCKASISKVVIQADGNAIPCEVFKATDRKDWGTSVYRQTLQEILDSNSFSKLREKLIGSHCFECPIHSKLRIPNPKEGAVTMSC